MELNSKKYAYLKLQISPPSNQHKVRLTYSSYIYGSSKGQLILIQTSMKPSKSINLIFEGKERKIMHEEKP